MLIVKPPHQTNILFSISWNPNTNAEYYVVHMTPEKYCTPEVTTNVGPATNVILTLPRSWDYGAKPGGGRWTATASRWFICVVPWTSTHQGSYYPYMVYPPDRVDQFSGVGLECRTNSLLGSWTVTNSPWIGTNVTGYQLFRLLDGSTAPAHTNWFLFGNLEPKDWWPNVQ